MTELSSLTRQPTKLDYAAATQFKFNIIKLPKVEFFCTSVNIPGITLGETSQATPLKDIPIPGDKLNYASLNVSFLVDENLENYREIHGWLTGLGFPRSHEQFETFINAGKDRFPTSNATASFSFSNASSTNKLAIHHISQVMYLLVIISMNLQLWEVLQLLKLPHKT